MAENLAPERDKGAILVLARMDSNRLPGKALLDIAGTPLLARVVARLRLLEDLGPIIVATSDRGVDNPIAELAQELGVGLFRGSCDDVLGRCLACAREFDFDHIVRVSGDSPFIPADLVRWAWEHFRAGGADIVTNVFPRSFPAGLSVEVISIEALELLAAQASGPDDREHVTVGAYRTPERFIIENLTRNGGDGTDELRLTVDTPEDLARARSLAEKIEPNADTEAVISAARAISQA